MEGVWWPYLRPIWELFTVLPDKRRLDCVFKMPGEKHNIQLALLEIETWDRQTSWYSIVSLLVKDVLVQI